VASFEFFVGALRLSFVEPAAARGLACFLAAGFDFAFGILRATAVVVRARDTVCRALDAAAMRCRPFQFFD
jgi:hypothetical protein